MSAQFKLIPFILAEDGECHVVNGFVTFVSFV